MTYQSRNLLRCGHSLIELVAAMMASTILLGGLASTMYIARETAYTPLNTQHVLDTTEILNQLVDELKDATFVVENSPTLLKFVIPDRNGDGTEEVIKYEWSGTPGDPLERTFNTDPTTVIAEEVQTLQLVYTTSSENEEYTAYDVSAEQILLSNENLSGHQDRKVSEDKSFGQILDPANFPAGVPSNVKKWSISKVEYRAKQHGGTSGTYNVEIRPAGIPGNAPLSQTKSSVLQNESDLSSGWGWHTASGSPAFGLDPAGLYALTFMWLTDTDACKLRRYNTGNGGWLKTTDQGATWTLKTDYEAAYKVWGTYSTPGAPITITREYLHDVEISLQLGSLTGTRIDTRVSLANSPELLAQYWHADFDHDPRQVDGNGDGATDWQCVTPFTTDDASFNPASLVDGAWHAETDRAIQATIAGDLTVPFTVEMRARDASPYDGIGGLGLYLGISPSEYAWIYVFIAQNGDTTQNIALMDHDPAFGGALVTRVSIDKIDTGFADFKLVIDPVRRLTSFEVNGVDFGSSPFGVFSGTAEDTKIWAWETSGSTDFQVDAMTIRITP